MKKITISMLAIVLMTSLSFGQNLLLDPSFEGMANGDITGSTSPWSNTTNGVIIVENADDAYDGNKYVSMDHNFKNLRQSVTLTEGEEYTASIWFRFTEPQGPVNPNDGFLLEIKKDDGQQNGNGTAFIPGVDIQVEPTGTWTRASFTFTAPQPNLLFFIRKRGVPAGNNENPAWFDKAELVQGTLSTNSFEKFQFQAYPNPVNDVLNVSANASIDKIEVFNLLGKNVKSIELNVQNSQIPMSDLSSGIYILRTHIQGSINTQKLIIK